MFLVSQSLLCTHTSTQRVCEVISSFCEHFLNSQFLSCSETCILMCGFCRASSHLGYDNEHSNACGRRGRVPLERPALRLLHPDYGPPHAQAQKQVQHLDLGGNVKNWRKMKTQINKVSNSQNLAHFILR